VPRLWPSDTLHKVLSYKQKGGRATQGGSRDLTGGYRGCRPRSTREAVEKKKQPGNIFKSAHAACRGEKKVRPSQRGKKEVNIHNELKFGNGRELQKGEHRSGHSCGGRGVQGCGGSSGGGMSHDNSKEGGDPCSSQRTFESVANK